MNNELLFTVEIEKLSLLSETNVFQFCTNDENSTIPIFGYLSEDTASTISCYFSEDNRTLGSKTFVLKSFDERTSIPNVKQWAIDSGLEPANLYLLDIVKSSSIQALQNLENEVEIISFRSSDKQDYDGIKLSKSPIKKAWSMGLNNAYVLNEDDDEFETIHDEWNKNSYFLFIKK